MGHKYRRWTMRLSRVKGRDRKRKIGTVVLCVAAVALPVVAIKVFEHFRGYK
jgi:hypothetical protein